MKKLLFGILAMMMIFAIVGCDTQGETPEWTEVFSLDGLEGTWNDLPASYVITKDDITGKVAGETVDGYPYSCEDFEAALGQGQLSLFVNRDKTKLKFVIASGETKIEQIYTKQ